MTGWLRPLWLLSVALIFAAPAAHADVVYKCVDANGKVTYSQNPCYGEDWHRFGDPGAAPPKPKAAKPADVKPASTAEPATAKPPPKKPLPTS